MSNDHKIRDALLASSMVGMASVIAGAATTYGPWSSEKYTEEGGTELDLARKVLNERHGEGPQADEYIVPEPHRTTYAKDAIDPLTNERSRLNRETKTISGSVKNWRSARGFYKDAKSCHGDAKTLSGEYQRDEMLDRRPEENSIQLVDRNAVQAKLPINAAHNAATGQKIHDIEAYPHGAPDARQVKEHIRHPYPPTASGQGGSLGTRPQSINNYNQYPPTRIVQGQSSGHRAPSIESTSQYSTARTHQSSQYTGDQISQYDGHQQYPSGTA